jgi:hypothetical protein
MIDWLNNPTRDQELTSRKTSWYRRLINQCFVDRVNDYDVYIQDMDVSNSDWRSILLSRNNYQGADKVWTEEHFKSTQQYTKLF